MKEGGFRNPFLENLLLKIQHLPKKIKTTFKLSILFQFQNQENIQKSVKIPNYMVQEYIVA